MKTIVAKIISILLILCLILGISSCGDNSYVATMMVRYSKTNEAHFSFGSFSGSLSERLSNSYTQDTTLSYTASLDEGELSVFYKTGSVECPLFTIKGGESISDSGVGYLTNGESVRIVIRTAENVTCKGGTIDVSVDKP